MTYEEYTRYRHRRKILKRNNRLSNNNNHYNEYEGHIESTPPSNPQSLQPLMAIAVASTIVHLGRGLDGLELADRLGTIIPVQSAPPEVRLISAAACAIIFVSAPYWSVALGRVVDRAAHLFWCRVNDFRRWAHQSYDRVRGR